MRAGKNDPHLAGLFADVQHHRADSLVGAVRFAGYLLALGQQGLRPAQIDHKRTALPASGFSGDDLALSLHVFLEDASAFGFTDPLNEHLLCGLGGDTTQFGGVNLLVTVPGGDLPRLPVNGHHEVVRSPEVLPGCREERRLDELEHQLGVYVFLAMKGVHQA